MFRKIAALKKKLSLYLVLYKNGGVAAAKYLGVKVGEGCRIYTLNFGSEPFLITLGDRVTITSGVKILTHDGSTWLVRDNGVRYQKYLPVEIGSDVFIGVNTIIMPGVVIGSNVVVGAGSVVTKDLASGFVYVGNPARSIGSFEQFKEKVRNTCVLDSELNGDLAYNDRVHDAIRRAEIKVNHGRD